MNYVIQLIFCFLLLFLRRSSRKHCKRTNWKRLSFVCARGLRFSVRAVLKALVGPVLHHPNQRLYARNMSLLLQTNHVELCDLSTFVFFFFFEIWVNDEKLLMKPKRTVRAERVYTNHCDRSETRQTYSTSEQLEGTETSFRGRRI